MLDVDDRREPLLEGEGERDACFAALGESERLTSDPGVDARELALALLKGSDLARMRLRLRAMHC